MQIRTILKMNSWISLMIIAVSLLLLILSVREISDADKKADIAEQIYINTLERALLREEYLLHREDHLLEKWNQKTEEVRALIAIAENIFFSPSNIELIERIKEDFDSTTSLFQRAIQKNGTDACLSQEGEKRLFSRIFVSKYSMLEKANKLRMLKQKASSDAQNRMIVILFVLITVAVMSAISNTLFVNLKLNRGISAMIEGSRIMGSGNLDYRIPISGSNELSDLAGKVNDMAYHLKQTHTSVENLRTEIEKRRLSEEKLRTTLYSIGDAVIATDAEGRVMQMNSVAEHLTGWTEADALGKPLETIFHIINEGTRNEVENPVIRVLKEGKVIGLANHTLLISEDGTERPIADSGAPIKNDIGEITGVVLVFRDQTEDRDAEKALRESEEKYRILVEQQEDAICRWLPDTTLTFVNESYCRFFGKTREELPGMKWLEFIPETARDSVRQFCESLAVNPKTHSYEHEVTDAQGNTRWQSWIDTPIIVNGILTEFQSVGRDITERRHAEDALRKSEERLRFALETSQIGAWDLSLTDHTAYRSLLHDRIFGYQELLPEWTYEMFLEHVHPEDRSYVNDKFKTAVETRKDWNFECRIYRADGRLRWIWAAGRQISDDSGVFIRMAGVVQDITERKNTEFALKKLTEELEQRVAERTAEVQDLYNNAPCGYHSLDINGTFVHINDTELNWLGYTRDEVIGKKTAADILTEQSRIMFKRFFPIFKERGWMKDLEFEMIRKDGSVFPVLLNATAIKDSEGNYLSSRSTLFDITERKKAEYEIARKSEELILANIALEKAARMKDEFLAGMSHELRTPLTGVISLSESLSEEVYGPLNEKQQKVLKTVGESGQHLLSLINDILDLSKVESGQLELQIEKCSVSDICQGSLQIIKGMANKKKHKISFDMNPVSLSIDADPRRLKQIIVNLLSNAVKFTPERGEIRLTVEGDSNSRVLRFTVSDTGIGIEPEDLPKLFMPFVQLDSSLSRQYSGTGLGLSLVRSMAELHGGRVSVESEVGKGSRFTVSLPWNTPAQMLPEFSDTDTEPAPAAEPQAARSLILIIEDNEINIETYSDYLRSKGYEVIVAQNGEEGIQNARKNKPDLILMDIQMPGMDGWEAIGLLRNDADPKVASAPIIALTALAMPGDREKCISAGANDYLSKPVRLKLLLETVEKHLKRSEPGFAGFRDYHD